MALSVCVCVCVPGGRYDVTVHNGMYGLGLVLTEVMAGSVFVTKFTDFPNNAPNPAQQAGEWG